MELQAFIEEIAREAGAITLKYFNSARLQVETKSNNTPVTQADRESEQFLRTQIRKHFPNDSIIGEEYGEELARSDAKWIVDPLDGTQTFVRGVPLYGTLIARQEGETVTHGCVFLPALNEIVYAERGKGCLWNGHPCHVTDTRTLEASSILTTDHVGLERLIGKNTSSALLEGVKFCRSWGDCYGHVLVATGRADAMLDPQTAIWDVAPLSVIIEEAGGVYRDFKGEHTITGGSFISSNPHIYPTLFELITQSVSEE